MNSIWIASDADGLLCIFDVPPKIDQGEWFGKIFGGLPESWLPEIRPGECREFRAVKEVGGLMRDDAVGTKVVNQAWNEGGHGTCGHSGLAHSCKTWKEPVKSGEPTNENA